MSAEAQERQAYAEWRSAEAGRPVPELPSGLYQAISVYGTARAKLSIKARYGGVGETGEAQEEVAAAMLAVQEEYTLAVRALGVAW
jgi:hypothetical protein